jgi:hypothetical protein
MKGFYRKVAISSSSLKPAITLLVSEIPLILLCQFFEFSYFPFDFKELGLLAVSFNP